LFLAQWLKPVILATPEADSGRAEVLGESRQKVHKISSQPIKAGHGGTCLSTLV
jgi:hypothetical protein